MNHIMITTRSKNFRFTENQDDEYVTIKLDNLTENFIKGFDYLAVMCSCELVTVLKNSIEVDNTDINSSRVELKTSPENYQELKNNGGHRYVMIFKFRSRYVLIRFDDIEFLNGLYTLMNWASNRIKFRFDIKSFYDYKQPRNQLYNQYVKHDINPNTESVKNIVSNLKLIIDDLLNIVIEYYPNICNTVLNNNGSTFKVYCETLCDGTYDICEVCRNKYHGGICKSVFKTSVRFDPVD